MGIKAVNRDFKELLKKNNFPMKKIENEESYLYQACLELSDNRQVDFAVSISKNKNYPIAQIVFNKIATVTNEDDRNKWLNIINEINLIQGLYYSMGIDQNNDIYARHVTWLEDDVEGFFEVLKQGGNIIRVAIQKIEQEFN